MPLLLLVGVLGHVQKGRQHVFYVVVELDFHRDASFLALSSYGWIDHLLEDLGVRGSELGASSGWMLDFEEHGHHLAYPQTCRTRSPRAYALRIPVHIQNHTRRHVADALDLTVVDVTRPRPPLDHVHPGVDVHNRHERHELQRLSHVRPELSLVLYVHCQHGDLETFVLRRDGVEHVLAETQRESSIGRREFLPPRIQKAPRRLPHHRRRLLRHAIAQRRHLLVHRVEWHERPHCGNLATWRMIDRKSRPGADWLKMFNYRLDWLKCVYLDQSMQRKAFSRQLVMTMEETWTPARLEELGVKPRVVNVLAHGHIRSGIDVKQLALLVRNADYKPRGFGALVLRFQDPRASIMVYKSGKFVVVGTTHPDEAKAALDKFLSILQKISFPHELGSFTIANVVGSLDVKFRIRLEGLASDHIRFSTYEPELFPGLIYRMLRPKCTLLVFVSGKIVVTGAKVPEQIDEAVCKLYPVLLQYRLRSSQSDDEDDDSMDGSEAEDYGIDADDELDDGREEDDAILI